MAHHDDIDFWHDADHRYVQRRQPRRRRIDPFYARVAGLATAGALLVPVALTLRPDPDTNVLRTGPNGGGAVAIPGIHAGEATTTTPVVTAGGLVVESTAPSTLPPSTASSAPVTAAPTVPATTARTVPITAKVPATSPTTAPTTAAPTTAAVACSSTYKVVSGDSWYGIASRAGVPLRELLAANTASSTSGLFAGNVVCLPPGARSLASATTVAKAPAAPTTVKPAATAPPTTDAPAPPAPAASYSRDEVIAIIRAVWPDELEDKAIAVAIRESTLRPGVRNYCCYGLFQIYYSVHKSWLAGMGVTSASDLYDPTVNTQAAYALYQRAGGWGPWGG